MEYFDTIEVHAEGEPGRIVLNAAELVKGESMEERLAYCRENLDWLRYLLLHEPRGYPALCAVLLLPPVNDGSDFGIIVLEQGGFTPMSGSNTICAVTAAIEGSLITPRGERTTVVIDTAVGVVKAEAAIRPDGKVASVTVINVPSFAVQIDAPLVLPEFGQIAVDVVFGGQFFAQMDLAQLGLELDPNNGKALARLGVMIKMAAREQLEVVHPLYPDINEIALVMLHSGPPAPGKVNRNTVVLSNSVLDPNDPSSWVGVLDRSPCGTGTSARMAALYARGQLELNKNFDHHSIIGSKFTGRLIGTEQVPGYQAVRPTITGRAWITGRAQWSAHPADIFPQGYTLSDIWAPQAQETT
ncbi:proline racemase family protein [Glutamicibacter sp. NPDC087344]|uniref:proline racemase family protein n=1 Tax=Glutamicibacter sp. NPDC087344 TaxID=3363994 RepID=UPI003812AD8D